MNKLRVLSRSCALGLFVCSVWATLRYGSALRFAPGVLLALLIGALPLALAHGKLWARRGRRYVTHRHDDESGATFVSERPDPAADSALSRVAGSIERDERYQGVRSDDFPEGEGLIVTHGGFDSSFVRRTDDGRLVVTGASERTRSLARYVAQVRDVTMCERSNNPFFGPIPIRGAPRVFLSVSLVVLCVLGAGSVVGAAYPSSAYNTLEKTVFVTYDARATLDPRVSETDAGLDKAAFMASALSEEAVEIRWEQNGSAYLVEDGKQALAISNDVRVHLRTARERRLSDTQTARADRIEIELHTAERAVAAALTARIESGTTGTHASKLRALRDRLRRTAERPVRLSVRST